MSKTGSYAENATLIVHTNKGVNSLKCKKKYLHSIIIDRRQDDGYLINSGLSQIIRG